MKSILYVARAGLPLDATGVRITAIARVLATLDYNVHFVCERRIDAQIKNSGFIKVEDTENEQGFCLSPIEEHYFYDGFMYSYLQAHSGQKKDALLDLIELCSAKKAFDRVSSIAERENAKIIILYNDVYGLTKRLLPYCQKKKITLLADVTEWYEKKKKGTFAEKLVVYLTDKRIRKLDRHLAGVIAVSPFFRDYYENIGVKTLMIPPLMQFGNGEKKESQAEISKQEIKFVYAGSPGGKDIVLPFINAIIKANQINRKLRLDLIGIDNNFLKQNGIQDGSKVGVFAHGRLSHEETLDYVRDADFGFLFRHNQRYAKAGFSTKFSECMSVGTAMVCNRIGGTDAVIDEGQDGFVLDEITEEALVEFLNQLVQMDRSQIEVIKENARNKANNLFNSDKYINQVGRFLEEVKQDEH